MTLPSTNVFCIVIDVLCCLLCATAVSWSLSNVLCHIVMQVDAVGRHCGKLPRSQPAGQGDCGHDDQTPPSKDSARHLVVMHAGRDYYVASDYAC